MSRARLASPSRFSRIAGLALLGWTGFAFGLALTWIAGRFFATLLGWA
jgi:hypothetical protein